MSKLWLIFQHEFRRNVFRKSFILVLLSLPLYFLFVILFVRVMESVGTSNVPLGYVDHSGFLVDPRPVPGSAYEPVEMIPFQTESEAALALEKGEIQAYFTLASDYLASGKSELFYRKRPSDKTTSQFYDFLQVNLLAAQPPEVALRATLGDRVTIRSQADGRDYPGGDPTLGLLLPVFTSIGFIGLLVTSSGYLMDSIFREKENRSMEMLLTSVSVRQAVSGKVLAVAAISLTQLTVWVLIGFLAVWLGGGFFGVAFFQDLQVEWVSLLGVLAVALPSYVMATALMFTVGLLIGTHQESEQAGWMIFMAYLMGLYLDMAIAKNPGSAPAVVLSLLPFTSLITLGFRSILTAVPAWQFVASAVIQLLCALGVLWVAWRVLRLGMLRYGKRLRMREVFHRTHLAAGRGGG